MKNKVLFFVLLVLVLGGSLSLSAAENPDPRASVKLRVVAVNPSKEKPQTVPIKIYLPKEVIPDDVIDMGELKVGYDSSKGVYYAYSDGVELKPQETRVFEVNLEDVWKIKNDEMSKLKEQTALALKHLENTPHYANAKSIVDSIDHRLNEIQVKQEDLSISREEHIGAFRVNQLTMQQIRSDISLIEKMLQTSGGPPSIEFLKDTVFEKKKDIERITAWKIIIGLIGLIAFLGIAFYLKWFFAIKTKRQAKPSDSVYQGAPRISESPDEGGDVEQVDITKLLKPGGKDKQKAV